MNVNEADLKHRQPSDRELGRQIGRQTERQTDRQTDKQSADVQLKVLEQH